VSFHGRRRRGGNAGWFNTLGLVLGVTLLLVVLITVLIGCLRESRAMKIILELETDEERHAFLVPPETKYFIGPGQILASNYAARKFIHAPILLTVEISSGRFCSEMPVPQLPNSTT